jgi:hypothetical protein
MLLLLDGRLSHHVLHLNLLWLLEMSFLLRIAAQNRGQ